MEICVIDRLNEKGQGRGDRNGKKIDVKGALVGETVEYTPRCKKRGVTIGSLTQILNPSLERVPDRCSHASVCGGCNFHGWDYNEQLKWKKQQIEKLFSFPIEEVVPAQNVWYYRNKMEFSFSEDKSKNRYLGLTMEDSRGKVFNQVDCALCPEWMLRTRHMVFEFWMTQPDLAAYYLHRNEGSLRTLTCRYSPNTQDRMVILGVSGNPQYALTFDQLQGFKQAILEANNDASNVSIFLVLTHIEKGVPTTTTEMHIHGKDHYEETVLGKRFLVSPQAFFQPNPSQAEVLYQTGYDFLEPKTTDHILDLYCGVGSIGICLKDQVATVLGIELNRYAVCDAKRNIEINQLSNIDVIVGDVKDVLQHHQNKPFDAVIVDPPRAGLDEKVIEILGQMRSKKILYISCNPKTMSRDLPLLEQKGYRLKRLKGVDQFAQTTHLEMVGLLEIE